jgi:hypothetical protein
MSWFNKLPIELQETYQELITSGFDDQFAYEMVDDMYQDSLMGDEDDDV